MVLLTTMINMITMITIVMITLVMALLTPPSLVAAAGHSAATPHHTDCHSHTDLINKGKDKDKNCKRKSVIPGHQNH